MLTIEEKGSIVYTGSPKRRCFIIFLIVLGLLAFAAIGIVAGYFIGRNSAAKNCEDDSDTKTQNGKFTQKQREEINKNAVEMVSTEELRNNLK